MSSLTIQTEPVTGAHRFSHHAMATTYEIFIIHEDAAYAHEAACEAFAEIDRLELDLSRFIENSDISKINSLAANESAIVGLAAFECLALSAEIYHATNGAFDVNVGQLLNCWLDSNKKLQTPSQNELERSRRLSGFHLLELLEESRSVKVLANPLQIDLGGIGKGYAIDQIVALLREWEIDTALLSGGASSVFAIGAPPGKKGWPVSFSSPGKSAQKLACLHLREKALSGSGLMKGQHIIDPRTARPVRGNFAVWTCALNATAADALSTAFMIMTETEVQEFCEQNSDIMAMRLARNDDKPEERFVRFGPWQELE